MFINPLPAAAVPAAPERIRETADPHPVDSSPAAQPHSAAAAAPSDAHLPAQPLADNDADVGEAHALLPQHHARSAARSSGEADTTAPRGSDVQDYGHDGSDSESVSLDSPAAGRPPDRSAATMANPYFQIHGALQNPFAEPADGGTDSSRGHKVC